YGQNHLIVSRRTICMRGISATSWEGRIPEIPTVCQTRSTAVSRTGKSSNGRAATRKGHGEIRNYSVRNNNIVGNGFESGRTRTSKTVRHLQSNRDGESR